MMSDTIQPTNSPVAVPLHNTPLGIFKSLSAARKNLLAIIPKVATTQPILSGKTGIRWHMVMDPGAIREILLDRVNDYPKSDATKNLLRPAIGESLFVAEGAHWRWQRRAAAPVFTHRNMMNLAPIMTGAAERAAQRITDAGPRGIDMMDEMITTTFDVIADVTFSGGDTFDRDKVHNAIDDYIAEAGKVSLFDILGAPSWVPRPGRMRASGALKEMKTVADTAIDERVKRGAEGIPDLLDLLLAGVDPETKRSTIRGAKRAPRPRRHRG
jgi:cytochrome P450